MKRALMRVFCRVRDTISYDVVLRLQILWYSYRLRRLSSKVHPEMSLVVHAFQEAEDSEQKRHLELWFGYPCSEDDTEGEGSLCCRCGASMIPLNVDRSVLAVYHMKSIKDKDGRL